MWTGSDLDESWCVSSILFLSWAPGSASHLWPSACQWLSSPWWVSSRWLSGPKGSTAVTWRSSETILLSAHPSFPSSCRGLPHSSFTLFVGVKYLHPHQKGALPFSFPQNLHWNWKESNPIPPSKPNFVCHFLFSIPIALGENVKPYTCFNFLLITNKPILTIKFLCIWAPRAVFTFRLPSVHWMMYCR